MGVKIADCISVTMVRRKTASWHTTDQLKRTITASSDKATPTNVHVSHPQLSCDFWWVGSTVLQILPVREYLVRMPSLYIGQ